MDGVRELRFEVSDIVAGEIDAAVASGDYADAADVMSDALILWRRWREAQLQRLRELAREGLESGESEPVPHDWVEQIIARAQRGAG